MWYIVDAEPGAELLYGFARDVTKEEFRRAIEENTLLDLVRHVPVRPGDVFFIPAGTLHAIGKGILIAEIQQNSNTTYRVYDYGRVGKDGKPRELHIAKALDVTRLTPAEEPALSPAAVLPCGTRCQKLGSCRYFDTMKLEISGSYTPEEHAGSYAHYLCLAGSGVLRYDGGELAFEKGSSIFIPCGARVREICGTCTLLHTAAPENK